MPERSADADIAEFCDSAAVATAAASGGGFGTPIAPFGRPAAGTRGAGAFDSGPGGASEPHGTAGFAAGFSAGKSVWPAFASLTAFDPSGTSTPGTAPNGGFAAGAGPSALAGPTNVRLNADATPEPGGAAAGFAPNADADPCCDAGLASVAADFENAEPAAFAEFAALAAPSKVALGVALGAAADSGESASIALPSLAITKLVLHFGQRIFMPDSGMRRSSTSYGDLHDTHSTLIMDDRTALLTPHVLRGAFRRDPIPNG